MGDNFLTVIKIAQKTCTRSSVTLNQRVVTISQRFKIKSGLYQINEVGEGMLITRTCPANQSLLKISQYGSGYCLKWTCDLE